MDLKNVTKKIISWVLGVPALMLVLGETDDLSAYGYKLIALLVVLFVLWINNVFDKCKE